MRVSLTLMAEPGKSSGLRAPTLAVLAGGEGSRMGRAKGSLRICGRPILQYLLDQINWPDPTLLVTAPGRERPEAWQRFDQEATDPVAGLGPLRGVLTALESATSPLLIVTTVDMPAVRIEQLQWLAEQLRSRPDALGVMCSRRLGSSERIEPFPCAFHREAQEWVRMQLEQGMRSVHALAQGREVFVLPAPADWPEETWTNLNSPQDLIAFEQWLSHRSDRGG